MIAATRAGTKLMVGPPSLVGGTSVPGWISIIIVRIAASGIETPKKPESATGAVTVPALSGKAISTVTASSSPARPNNSAPSVPGRTLKTTSPGCARRGMQAVPVGPLRGSGAADEPVKDARVTVAAFVDDWTRKALPASNRKPTTQGNYATIARTHVSPAPFGALTLDRLRPSDLEALLVAKRGAGLSSSTVRTIYTVARAVLDIAVRDGLVRRNVAAAVKRPAVKRTDARYLTAEEVGRLLAAARDDRLYPLVVLLLGTGLRRGEALGLHWRDVDVAAGVLRVR
jgi:hypothetical protein